MLSAQCLITGETDSVAAINPREEPQGLSLCEAIWVNPTNSLVEIGG